jgi:Spy/CpxP family protein refolding chaperone
MNRFHSLTAGVLVAGLLATGVAFAQGPRGGGPGGPGGPGFGGGRPGGPALALGALNLTESQQQQIREIREQERDAMRQLEERLRQARDAQGGAIQAIPVDEGLIRTTTQALADVQIEAAIQQAYIHSRIWAVLTPAQQTQAKTVQAQREARQEERRSQSPQRRRDRQLQ